jgi:hypothetical protein
MIPTSGRCVLRGVRETEREMERERGRQTETEGERETEREGEREGERGRCKVPLDRRQRVPRHEKALLWGIPVVDGEELRVREWEPGAPDAPDTVRLVEGKQLQPPLLDHLWALLWDLTPPHLSLVGRREAGTISEIVGSFALQAHEMERPLHEWRRLRFLSEMSEEESWRRGARARQREVKRESEWENPYLCSTRRLTEGLLSMYSVHKGQMISSSYRSNSNRSQPAHSGWNQLLHPATLAIHSM